MSIWCCNYRDVSGDLHVICLGHYYEDAHRWFNAPHEGIKIVGKLWNMMQ